MIIFAGIKHPSFGQGSEALAELAGLTVPEKQVERITKRIGQERVAERECEVQAFLSLPLMQKVSSPIHETVDLAVVEMDGGRLQILTAVVPRHCPCRTRHRSTERDLTMRKRRSHIRAIGEKTRSAC